MENVLVDTSFLINLSTPTHKFHATALAYHREFIDRGVIMFLSTIVISEYEVRQRARDLGLKNYIVLPFNYQDAVSAGAVLDPLFGVKESGADRVAVKDDAKLLAQCIVSGVRHFITADEKCAKRIDKLRANGAVPGLPCAIDISSPFSADWFAPENQTGLDLRP